MFRAILELLVTFIVVMVARSLLTGLFKGISNATAQSFQQAAQAQKTQNAPSEPRGNELHRDPVCGTFVAESTAYKRQSGSQTFYYCSDTCRGKHTPVMR